MRNKKIFVNVGTFFLLSFILIYLGFSQVSTIVSSQTGVGLDVKVKSSKQDYFLGEVISISLDITNTSSTDIPVKGTNVESGYVKIFIASDDQKFKEYSNSSWGRAKTKGTIIKAGQTASSQAKIFWNFSPVNRFSNLEGFEKSHIMTDYVFPAAGVYLIKAVLYIPGTNPVQIESQPIQIVVNEPTGDDLQVWNRIKNNGEIAYFIQQGSFKTYKDEERDKLINEIEQIIRAYPNGQLADKMKQTLEKFQLDEEKRKQQIEKAKLKP